MGEISDLNYSVLFGTANNFLRLETLREANDRVSNAIAKRPIFRQYDIDDTVLSSSDGQKFETQFSTCGARHSPKYFGLKKGISQYTMIASHVPVNIRIFKVTSQSVIIGKLSAYARKNRTKKALWELDNIQRSSYLLAYIDSLTMRRNVQRALNRGESYHKLRRVPWPMLTPGVSG